MSKLLYHTLYETALVAFAQTLPPDVSPSPRAWVIVVPVRKYRREMCNLIFGNEDLMSLSRDDLDSISRGKPTLSFSSVVLHPADVPVVFVAERARTPLSWGLRRKSPGAWYF